MLHYSFIFMKITIMKKKVTSLGLFLLFMVSGLFSQTYEQCDFYIRSDFSSECLLTTYKNPLSPNYLHDESAGADEDLISVSIMDLMGKIIITTDKKEINIDKLIYGQYIVKIINSQNKVQYLKLIKQ